MVPRAYQKKLAGYAPDQLQILKFLNNVFVFIVTIGYDCQPYHSGTFVFVW